jgi:ATP-dependent RNA helicase DDX27
MTIPEEEGEGEFNNDCGFFGGLEVEEPAVEASVLDDAPTLDAGNKYVALEEKLAQIRKEKQLALADDTVPIKDKRKDKKGRKDKKEVSDSEDELVTEQVEPVATVDYFDSEAGALGQTAETFADFNLSRQLLKGLALVKFDKPTPIQRAAIPVALMGKDICGGAVTGSGKTAAFLIPVIERLIHRPRSSAAATRVLVLLPTRELAVQCHDVAIKLAKFTDVRCCLAAGGLPMRAQQADLKMRPELVIATPGRLIDHLRNSPSFSLDSVEILILDEADRMLEDGFADELDEIIRHTPVHRQTILFSATMTDNVNELVRLSLRKPARIFVDNNTTISRTLQQEFVRIREEREADRLPLLLTLCRRTCSERCIVFFPTKDLAHQFRLILGLVGLRCAELHGGLTQAERLDALERFKDGAVDFLTATDVAARGLDIRGVKFVLNYSMPANYKLYLHRVGRTARAGSGGCSITLVGEGADRKLLKMVIKNSTVSVKHRLIQPNVIDSHRVIIDEMQSALKKLLEEEREAKLLISTGKELRRAENLLEHGKEIATRPKKTWFQSVSQKQQAKKRDISSLGHDAKRASGKSKSKLKRVK